MMAIGQFCMFLSSSYYQNHSLSITLMMLGLTTLIFGNGFFKPNISTMVGQLYDQTDSRKDSAYTIFYMGINLGAFFSPLVCGGLGDTGNPADFKWGFLAACIGMIISIITFELLKNKYLNTPGGEPIGTVANAKRLPDAAATGAVGDREAVNTNVLPDLAQTPAKKSNSGIITAAILILAVVGLKMFMFTGGESGSTGQVLTITLINNWITAGILCATVIIPASIIMDKSLTKVEKERIGVIYIAAFFVIFFWAAFEQAGASLTFFADEQTNRVIGGWEMPASWFSSFNAIFIVILAPVSSLIWSALRKKGNEPSSPTKQAFGLFFLSLGYLVIALGVRDVAPGVKVSFFWLTTLYLLHTIGELCLSPIGLSMVNKLAPVRFASLLMGVWFLSTAAANNFAGVLSSLYPSDGKATVFLGYHMNNLYDFFILFVIMSAVAALMLFFLTKKLQKMMHGVD
ncbi:MAG TPA: peptide MFS transporter, partial [Chitinophagaceae bacterium]|nr:peptide MFS transporter [Chitinophagaceae bacterium]